MAQPPLPSTTAIKIPLRTIHLHAQAQLGDIGLVTEAGDTQSIVGTEGYLPPEGPGTPQADLFSLGKVLYEISTGMDRRRFAELRDDLREWPDRNAVFEFNPIVLRACAKDPAQRYQTAEQLRADLALLQAGKSVLRARTHHRRRTFFVKLAAALTVCAVLVAGGMVVFRELARSSINPSDRLSKDPEANKEYLEGVHCARRDTAEGFTQGIAHFKRAIEIDPGFAMAYNGLYEIYVANPEKPEVRECVSKMVELEPNLAEAHAALGYLGFLDWKWPEAEPHFLKAIELNPKCAIAHMRYGFCLVYAGRLDEGYRELSAAERLNPTSPRIKKNIGHVFYLKRQFREAMAQYQKATDLEPAYSTDRWIGRCYRALGDYSNAIVRFEQMALRDTDGPASVRQRFKDLRQAYAEDGPRGYWLKRIEQVTPADQDYFYRHAEAYAHLGDYDRAFDLLKEYYDTRPIPESLEWLLEDEIWDSVHEDPRFVALLKKTGLRK